MSSLTLQDAKRLRDIVTCGHDLEKIWPQSPLVAAPETVVKLDELKKLISTLDSAESDDLCRLAFHVRDLALDMTGRHLAAILVPFERLQNKTLSDHDFIVTDADGPAKPRDETKQLTVVAENLRSAFNVGAILRTAECFGVHEVLLTGYTPTPDQEKTAKTSMGTESLISWSHHPDTDSALEGLKARGFETVAFETVDGATELSDFVWPEKTALLLGNERFGLDHARIQNADHVVRIPLHGRKNSLNVGIAFGIAAASWRAAPPKESSANLAPSETIGLFHSTARQPFEARRQGAANTSNDVAYVELTSDARYRQALMGLEGFGRIWLLYRFHHNTHWKPLVMPPRGPRVKQGVFATRAPYRPNQIGLSCVELVKIDGRKIFVRGFDLLDQTPILDIKPYLPYADAFLESRTGWFETIEAAINQIEFANHANEQIDFIESNGLTQLRDFVSAQLEFDPLDSKRKRVTPSFDPGRPHCLCYRTWRIDFEIENETRTIRIKGLRSGYSDPDLAQGPDPYADKDLHRAFNQKFARNSDHPAFD